MRENHSPSHSDQKTFSLQIYYLAMPSVIGNERFDCLFIAISTNYWTNRFSYLNKRKNVTKKEVLTLAVSESLNH